MSEQENIRINKIDQLKYLGIEPYPAIIPKENTSAKEIFENYENGRKVSLYGRIMSIRIMGKAAFAEIKDYSGRVQIYVSENIKKNAYNFLFKKLLDIGDIISIEGFLFKTKVGKITVYVESFSLLSKSLRTLPQVKTDDKGIVHDAFSSIEQRYRMRYVDLIVNDNVKDIFVKRSKIIQFIRQYLNKFDYLEVETPILQPIPGGAQARPFRTHHNTLNIPIYLRISNELYLKKLIVGGFKGVYEFAKDFRNEGIDKTHNPEFTLLELYVAYKDYHWMMNFSEKLIRDLVLAINGKETLQFGDKIIEFKVPFTRISIFEAIEKYTGFDISKINEKDLHKICHKLGIEIQPGKGRIIDEIFRKRCESYYVKPTFIMDYPVEMSPLTKKHREKYGLSERFEMIINGQEIANAYSELNDPIDQVYRFKEQIKLAKKGDDEAMLLDKDFIQALEFGMPPSAGIGIGIDRLVMLLTKQTSIQEVIFFPQMRPK
ncbi:MAG TPA: lysine--tRNA ligase [Candidatus Angelobacter sp.]|jgi:lysyl-tRNA synthetase class 2|nr:lysine--tRNA ligase [Candidatus Angelobacter sp.]